MDLIAATDFRAVYHARGVYDQVLLPHYFDGVEDTDLVASLMRAHHGHPGNNPGLNILDLGCGTGRVTEVLAPYAASLHGVDSAAPMIEAFRERFPHAEADCQDTRKATEDLHTQGRGQSFNLVGAFWSLSYPILDLFEELTAEGVRPRADTAEALRCAQVFVQQVLGLVAPNGHLMALFFDADTAEQKLVTRLWETIAPFPGTGRGYAREIVLGVLQEAERRGEGRLLHIRHGGVAVASDAEAARRWFNVVHLKSLPALIADRSVCAEIDAFIAEHQEPSGEVLIPSGVHLIDFWTVARQTHLPNGLSRAV